VALACLYVMLAAPFIAAIQVIVYAGAIMVLVVFVIMLLNVEEEARRRARLRVLVPIAIALAAVFIAEASFILYSVRLSPYTPTVSSSDTGLTSSIGTGLFTRYLLPFEITSVLLLMAIVGAMTLARRAMTSMPAARAISGVPPTARGPAPHRTAARPMRKEEHAVSAPLIPVGDKNTNQEEH
jgi:NADH-quinone oxidoreductase subunit J